jgi:hypothetical protein
MGLPGFFWAVFSLLSGTRQIADLANLFDLGQLDRFWQAGSIKGSIGVVE